jgi:hypothetical protein
MISTLLPSGYLGGKWSVDEFVEEQETLCRHNCFSLGDLFPVLLPTDLSELLDGFR